MSTYTDGAPPSVKSAPSGKSPDEQPRAPRSAEAGAGSSWLQDEIQRRMAERKAGGSSGRHARHDGSGGAPPGGGHVPRHSVAPATAAPETAAPDSAPPEAAATQTAPAEPPRSPAVGAPSLPAAGPPVRRRPPEDIAWSGPAASTGADAPTDSEDQRPRPSRPVPRAYRSGTWRVPSAAPASFGGPGFDAPAVRSARPEEQPFFGGPGFDAPATHPPTAQDPGLHVVHRDPQAAGPAGNGADVLPPRAPARLLAASDDVVDALGRRPSAPDPEPVDGLAATGPLLPAAGDGSTVLWSATMPPPDADGMATATAAVEVPVRRSAQPRSTRVKVVLSERRGGAHPVRTVVDIQEGGVVGEMLRSNLIGSQLTVALRFALLAGLTLGLLPLAFALFPEIGRIEILGFRLPWVVLGVGVYPLLWALGWWHTRTAERVEQNFADDVQR